MKVAGKLQRRLVLSLEAIRDDSPSASSQPTELWDNKLPLFLATQLLILCFSSQREQIHPPLLSSARLGNNVIYQF